MSRRRQKSHPCPTPAKPSFGDEIAAKLALDYIQRQPPRSLDGTMPTRVYRCSCARWHLTSSTIPYSQRPTREAEASS